MAEQTEKAFLKQPKVFLASKKTGKGKKPEKGGNRFFKSVGLGFKTPREAIEALPLAVPLPQELKRAFSSFRENLRKSKNGSNFPHAH